MNVIKNELPSTKGYETWFPGATLIEIGVYLEGLIHGGAYFRNFTVLLSRRCQKLTTTLHF